MKRAALSAAAVAALALAEPAAAHGIGAVQDLPVPLWLFYYAGAAVLVLSFAALGVLWSRPRFDERAGRPLPASLQRVLLSPALRIVLGGLSFALLVLVFVAALLGHDSVGRNLAPTFVWVIFWLGLVPVVVLAGDVWRVLNPWRAAADAVAWLSARLGGWQPALYPERLGRWPAAVLLLAFVALELAYSDPSNPRVLALAIGLYSWITWVGVIVFGRAAWFGNAEAFSVYFGLLARIAPFATRERAGRREIVVRAPLSGLARGDERPGTVAFVAVMLGSVAFDGFSRTGWWRNLLFEAQEPHALDSPGLAELIGVAINVAGLAAAVAVVGLAYLAAVRAAELTAGRGRLAGDFVASLIPIALAYAVAHYFSLFVLRSQFAIPLLSDPLGKGWDVLGTGGFRPDVQVLTPNVVWYVQVGALIVGHVLGLVLAHDRAVALFRSARLAVRAQYAMLALMVAYTLGGMWILSQG